MARPVASDKETATIAIVGAESSSGTLLREALADSRVPGSRVNLYGLTDGEAVISEYAGEARLIQDPNLPEITAHRFIYLCETGELSDQVIGAVRHDSTVIDLVGCVPADREPRLVHPDVNRPRTGEPGGYFTVPHALAITLTELLHGIEAGPGVDQAVAALLRPASDFGDPGVEELREQTVRLLNFAEVPQAIFGAQLAFNVLGETRAREAAPAERIRDEAQRLLGWDRPRLAVSCLTVPVFYGHGVQLHVRTRQPTTLAVLRQTLSESPFFEPPVSRDGATPLQVATEAATRVAEPVDDGLGGFWIWAVVGEAGARAARLAVRLSATGDP